MSITRILLFAIVLSIREHLIWADPTNTTAASDEELILQAEKWFPEDKSLVGFEIYRQEIDREKNETKYVHTKYRDQFYIRKELLPWTKVVILNKDEDQLPGEEKQTRIVFRQTRKHPKQYTGHVAYVRAFNGVASVEWDLLGGGTEESFQENFAATFTPTQYGLSSLSGKVQICTNSIQNGIKYNSCSPKPNVKMRADDLSEESMPELQNDPMLQLPESLDKLKDNTDEAIKLENSSTQSNDEVPLQSAETNLKTKHGRRKGQGKKPSGQSKKQIKQYTKTAATTSKGQQKETTNTLSIYLTTLAPETSEDKSKVITNVTAVSLIAPETVNSFMIATQPSNITKGVNTTDNLSSNHNVSSEINDNDDKSEFLEAGSSKSNGESPGKENSILIDLVKLKKKSILGMDNITHVSVFEDKLSPFTGILDCKYEKGSLDDLGSTNLHMKTRIVDFLLKTVRAQCYHHMRESTLNLFHEGLVSLGNDLKIYVNPEHEFYTSKILSREQWTKVISAIYLSVYSQAYIQQLETGKSWKDSRSPGNAKISVSIKTLTILIIKGVELIDQLENHFVKFVKSLVNALNERYTKSLKEAMFLMDDFPDATDELDILYEDRIQIKALKEFVLFGLEDSRGKRGNELDKAFYEFYARRLPVISSKLV